MKKKEETRGVARVLADALGRALAGGDRGGDRSASVGEVGEEAERSRPPVDRTME